MKTTIRFSALLAGAFLAAPLFAEVERKEQGNLVTEDVPEIPQRIIDRMMQYQNTRSASFQDWDPAGTGMLIATRFGETRQFHTVSQPGGARRQITFFNEPVGGAAMSPNPSHRSFLFTRDVGGGEFYQIFKFDLDSGAHQMLTDGQSRNGAMLWSHDGGKFSYYSTKRNGRDWDLYISDARTPKQAKLVLQEGGTWVPVDWSPDNKKLLVINYVSVNESYYHILDPATSQLSQINPSEEKIAYGSAVWSKDGKGVFMASDEGSEFTRLKYYDLANKSFTDLTADIDWDVEGVEASPKGDTIAFTTNENGFGKLYLLDTKSKKYKRVRNIPAGQIGGLEFHPDGRRLALVINTPQTPGDVYALDLNDQSLERWTYSEVGGLSTTSFSVPSIISYPTFDQVGGKSRMIPAIYYKPKTRGPHPVVIYIHGGPEGQYSPHFSSTVQYWVNELGIAVLAPNVRGSAGYGKSYLKMDNGFKREDTVKDIGALLDWVEKQPELDSERVAVYGGSYGGYMVLASMTHFNDRIKCGVDIVGISNFVTFLENTKEYRRDLRRVEYGDERDPKMRAFLERISPTTNAHKITKPMFIAQGRNDPRVPEAESQQIVSVIRKNGGKVWYMLAKDEGHGFRKKVNRDFFSHATALFWEQHLLN